MNTALIIKEVVKTTVLISGVIGLISLSFELVDQWESIQD